MHTINRKRFLAHLIGAGAAALAYGGDNKIKEKDLKQVTALPTAVQVQRPVDSLLTDFGDMVASYGAVSGQTNTIEIDFIGNESGSDKLPNDLGQYVRNVLEKTTQFQTYRALPEAIASPRSVAFALPQLLHDRPKPPPLKYRIVGSLERATEEIVKKRNLQFEAMFGGGHTSSNGELTGERGSTITALTIALTVENPDGVAVRGATAEYRIPVERSERNKSVSLYVGGNGVGAGSNLTITQESADALYNTIAMGIVHVLGNALRVPYYRCSAYFNPDPALEARVRDGYRRVAQSQLEHDLKLYMIVAGFRLDRSKPELTQDDRAKVLNELQHRSLGSASELAPYRLAMVDLLMQLWSGLDYRLAAGRVSDILADSEWRNREAVEAQLRQQADLVVAPSEFGWPDSTHIMVLDISRVTEASTRDRIVAALRTCKGCGEIRPHLKNKPLLGVILYSKTAEVQYALRGLNLQFVGYDTPSPRLLLVPAPALKAAAK